METWQTRIFVPRNDQFNNSLWAETILGLIIAPLVTKYSDSISWYWFTRYYCSSEMDADDCDITKIPSEFMDPQNNYYKSLRFRYAIAQDVKTSFESAADTLIKESGCAISDFREFDFIGNLGCDRHLEEPRTPARREERAHLVGEYYHSIAKLILHALKPNSKGQYYLPHHIDTDPKNETPFRVFHHIFCNSTDVPLYITQIHLIPGGPRNPARPEVLFHRVYF